MNVSNHDQRLQALVEQIKQEGRRPRLLLHCCCAPCSTAVLERLNEAFEITVYYYNPNIDTLDEHDLRAQELQHLMAAEGHPLDAVIEPYDPQRYLQAVKGLELEQEGGARCERCFDLRLRQSAAFAADHGYDWFTTTLTISPMKSAPLLNRLGEAIGRETGVPFLPSDFKKRGGYQRSVELSRLHGLYRQDYCGCAFSKAQRERERPGSVSSGS